MAKKSVIKPVITKVQGKKDVTKVPELDLVSDDKKISSQSNEELQSGKEPGEKDELIVMAPSSIQTFTNSGLVNYTKLSPNCTKPRNHKIDTITIHCMAGNLTVESCGNVFASPARQASSNYGVGSDGRIGLYVNESDRSWCSSSKDNDNRAVTIEVANDGGQVDNIDSALNWHVSDKAMKSLILLVADICKRNGISSLKWQNNKALIGQVDKQNMTVHRWFKAKACPGGYLMSKMSYIAEQVNALLASAPAPSPSTKDTYRVRKSWEDSKSQVGAFSILDNAIAKAKSLGQEYKVYDGKGNQVYPSSTQSNAQESNQQVRELYRVRLSWEDEASQVGAYKSLEGAIKAAKSKGFMYKVFNREGKMVYPTVVSAAKPAEEDKKVKGEVKKFETLKENIISNVSSRPNYERGKTYTATKDFNIYMCSGEFSNKKLNKHFTQDVEAPDASQPAVFKAGHQLTAKRLSFFDNGQWWMETELGWVKLWDEGTHTAFFI